MNTTYVYCKRCNTFYDYNEQNRNICDHISVLTVNGKIIEAIGEPKFFNIDLTRKSIKPVKLKKSTFTKLTTSDILYKILANNIPHSQNFYFKGCTYYVNKTSKKDELSIKVKRTEYSNFNWRNGPTGIKEVEIFLTMHKNVKHTVVDGLITIYEKKIKLSKTQLNLFNTVSKDKCAVYEAMWLTQKGNELYTGLTLVSGYIAFLKNTYYHSTKSIEHAIKGANRKERFKGKIKVKQAPKVLTAREQAENFFNINNIDKSLKIGYRDSIKIGNCPEGTKLFMRKHDLSFFHKHNAFDLLLKEPNNNFLQTVILSKRNKTK